MVTDFDKKAIFCKREKSLFMLRWEIMTLMKRKRLVSSPNVLPQSLRGQGGFDGGLCDLPFGGEVLVFIGK